MANIRVLVDTATQNELLTKVRRMKTDVEDNIDLELLRSATEKGIRSRAPVGVKGRLRRGTKVFIENVNGKQTLVINNPEARHLLPQEFGFTPHFVPIANPEVRAWLQKFSTPGAGSGHGIKGYIFVKRFTPFIKPTLDSLAREIEETGTDALDRYLR